MNADHEATWQGRSDAAEGDQARRWHQVVQPIDSATAPGLALLGFACDAGVARNQGRIGAAAGPQAIRRALCNLAVHDARPIYDAGSIVCEGDELEAAQAALGLRLHEVLDQGHWPIVLGGGHEVAWASWSGLAPWLDQRPEAPHRVGVLNLDAHFDLREADRPSSGTPFRQILLDGRERGWDVHYACLGLAPSSNTESLFETARAFDVAFRTDLDCQVFDAAFIATLDDWLRAVDHVYLTIDLDVLPGSTMPGVSAPATLGVPLGTLIQVVQHALGSGKVRLLDFAELNPSLDEDGRSARVAARIIHEAVHALEA